MNKRNEPIARVKIALAVGLVTVLTGCVGVVGGGGYYGGDAVVGGPDVYLFGGGGYDRGRDVHAYSQRGVASRAVAHPGGGGHAAGGGAHGGGGGGKR